MFLTPLLDPSYRETKPRSHHNNQVTKRGMKSSSGSDETGAANNKGEADIGKNLIVHDVANKIIELTLWLVLP